MGGARSENGSFHGKAMCAWLGIRGVMMGVVHTRGGCAISEYDMVTWCNTDFRLVHGPAALC